MSPPKDGRPTTRHSDRSIEWFVQKRKDIPLGDFSYHQRPINVPSGYVKTSTALISRPNVEYCQPHVIHRPNLSTDPIASLSFSTTQSNTRNRTAAASVVLNHSDRNRTR